MTCECDEFISLLGGAAASVSLPFESRQSVPAVYAENPIPIDATPRGMTSLNDAVGRIVSLANAGIHGVQYKLAIIIMTDGLENASQEYSHAAAKALLDDCRARNWQVIFLGASFDNATQAASYGNSMAATVAASAACLPEAMAETAAQIRAYRWCSPAAPE
jgi:hypothetical protein